MFIATSVCRTVLWKCFSFSAIQGEQGKELEGCVVALFHFIFVKDNKLWGIKQAFFRSNATNLVQMVTTLVAAMGVIYVQTFRVELSLSSKKARGYS